MSLRIYVEGEEQGSSKSNCRQAFRLFFEKTLRRGTFRVIASGSRSAAYKDFCAALKLHQDDFVVLLVDSEEAVALPPWEHLRARQDDKWPRPAEATNDHAHLMVQTLEAWFLADREALVSYYGEGFLVASMPGQPNVELIPKQTVLTSLRHASRKTRKGEYHKTRHGFDLLERIDPNRVRRASHHADRLFIVMEREAVA